MIDWIMRAAVEGSNTGIRWKLCSKLDVLDFADDIALISSTEKQIQQKVKSTKFWIYQLGASLLVGT